MKKAFYITSIAIIAALYSCRMWEKDDGLRPRPDFGFTTDTSTGYTTTVNVDEYIVVGLKAKHYKEMQTLTVKDDMGFTIKEATINSKAYVWSDTLRVGSVVGKKTYSFTITDGERSTTRKVIANVVGGPI